MTVDGRVRGRHDGARQARSGDRSAADGDSLPLDEVTLLAPVPEPARCTGSASTTARTRPRPARSGRRRRSCSRRCRPPPRRRAARCAAPRPCDGWTTRASWRWSWAPAARSPATRCRRRQRARPPAPRAPVDPRQGRRHVLPLGPVDHDRRRGPRPQALRLRTWVNGELRQDGLDRRHVFRVDELVAFISETCTLRPGDLILTGTPTGVGMALDPPRFLALGRRSADRDRAAWARSSTRSLEPVAAELSRARRLSACSITRSISPYSAASSALKKRSRSMSGGPAPRAGRCARRRSRRSARAC